MNIAEVEHREREKHGYLTWGENFKTLNRWTWHLDVDYGKTNFSCAWLLMKLMTVSVQN